MTRMHLSFALLSLAVFGTTLHAECVGLEITKREPFAGGMAFGDTGPYERIIGIARFAIDPKNKRNELIVDLDKAPRNAKGLVEFAADFCILAPKDPTKGNGAVLFDVNNRGNKLALGFFNDAPGSNDPTTAEHAGHGFLMRRGYTVVWCGWIGELLPGAGRMLLQAPIATENGKPIRGLVRYETGTDVPAESLPLSRREGHGSYPPTANAEKEGKLTWRMRETDPRVVIPNGQWKLERVPMMKRDDGGVPGTLPQVRLRVAGGFRAGYLYELVCEAEGPIVQGCGFAAVRDMISFLKYNRTEANPVARDGKTPINRALGFGISQSGRFLRHFLYQAFNVDERDRKVFDGLMPHVAGGGLGFYNHRFAQPTRHNGQHEDHLYPADVFPFTYGDSVDNFFTPPGRVESKAEPHGILTRLAEENVKLLPRIMHTQSAAEYWHRSGSLVHTDSAGRHDVSIPRNVRIYAFGGSQHGPAADPPKMGSADNLPNPGNFKPICRALLDALDEWAKNDIEPPASEYPTIKQELLVDWKQAGTHFPAIPGIRYPTVIQQPNALDLGERFTKGLIDIEPPKVLGSYRVLVPRSDDDGNDRGTLLPVEVAVPLATYTGWNLRKKEIGAEGMLMSLQGSFIPFPRTEKEREATGDPRVSIEKRYGSFDEYMKQFRAKCDEYVDKRWLLKEDVERLIKAREKYKEWFAR